MSEDPLWYKDAVIYQTHIKAYADSDADGIGDLRGLTQKLDYLADLGVTAIWILPFYPSPLRDDGYDIADYTAVNPSYGTLRDFKTFLREARRHGLRVITELVINHTSDEHPWFQRARRAEPDSPDRDFYVWSDTASEYSDARIIFQDFEVSNWAWDREANAYYWHRFYSHQPDLNFENPDVHDALLAAMDFWLDMGVDGMRLDAIPYLHEREGTNCENLPETHAFLKKLRAHVDANHSEKMLLAEANQWPEDAVAYFGEGDECHMAFHFPVMPRMFMAIRMEDRFPIIDILQQTPAIPPSTQWAMFLRNHDELTLEMVTDEERDYMYRMYARDPQARVNLGIRRRLAPLLGGDRKLIELMNGLLFSLPGTPIIYYGDEIGMGDNIYLGDRDAVRTPMQWSADRNAGFSRANPQRLYLPVVIDPEYHAEAVNVEAQQNNPNSLLWWTKRLIALRKRFKAFGRGDIEFLLPDNRKVLCFLRTYEDERILVVANLSRHVQYVELDLSQHAGRVPVELFGRTEFPPIGELPYFLTLGPHAFYWFALESVPEEVSVPDRIPGLDAATLAQTMTKKGREDLASVLEGWMTRRRWFGGKARKTKGAEIVEWIPIRVDPKAKKSRPSGYLLFVRVEYTEGDPETYAVGVTTASGVRAHDLRTYHPEAVIAKLRRSPDDERLLCDAVFDDDLRLALLQIIGRRRTLNGAEGKLVGSTAPDFRRAGGATGEVTTELLGAEQSNTSVVYGDRFVLKLVRRPDEGINPDLEIGRFLTDRVAFPNTPPLCGALEYRRSRNQPMTIGILQRYVPNEGDAWTYVLDAMNTFYEQVLTLPPTESQPTTHDPGHPLDLLGSQPPETLDDLLGGLASSVRLLGTRTAELHVALAQDTEDPGFAPERFSELYQRSLYQSMRSLTSRIFQVLERRREQLPETNQILDLQTVLLDRFKGLTAEAVDAQRIRVHGDYHLGQVLWTGKDFLIIDFEGEPARPLSERRIKRSPLRDVAGMVRSFHYAAYTPVYGGAREGRLADEDPAVLVPWGRAWYQWMSAGFLEAYLDTVAGTGLVPEKPSQLRTLLDAFVLEKAVYELGYEANNRPDWIRIPIHGILQMLEAD